MAQPGSALPLQMRCSSEDAGLLSTSCHLFFQVQSEGGGPLNVPQLESTPSQTTTLPLLATEAASCMIISSGPFLSFSSFVSLYPSFTHPTSSVDSASGEEWSAWSVCSATCGEGWQSRTRFCVSSSYSTQCSGPLREQRPCNNSAVCPGKPPPSYPPPCHLPALSQALSWTLPYPCKTHLTPQAPNNAIGPWIISTLTFQKQLCNKLCLHFKTIPAIIV